MPRFLSLPVGRAYAVVASRESGDSSWDGEALKTHSLYNPDLISMVTEAQSSHELSLTHLRTELRHIKEVGSTVSPLGGRGESALNWDSRGV
ncbi:hypothetical protein chiPu_0028170 [Chiloscyllium punctatum]|uniref:Uncharacterized protein n=1 Tax=Chiloscyllium punctatum TaxID=137246 RepID=A0A401TNR5_CHIPU|nr:hypothetical protein [Chiloscyllium punctatum]